MNIAQQSLYKSLPWDGLDLFDGKVSLGCISQFSGERLQEHWSSCFKLVKKQEITFQKHTKLKPSVLIHADCIYKMCALNELLSFPPI